MSVQPLINYQEYVLVCVCMYNTNGNVVYDSNCIIVSSSIITTCFHEVISGCMNYCTSYVIHYLLNNSQRLITNRNTVSHILLQIVKYY